MGRAAPPGAGELPLRLLITGGGTGGHLMPALAIAQAITELSSAVEPVLVGAQRGVEATILPSRPFRYYLLAAEPLYRERWWRNARWAAAGVRVAVQCRRVLAAERPAAVVGTGGYAAAPMLLAAALSRLPLVLQEQNAVPGLTTRWFARWARQIHLGFPEAESSLRPGRRTEVFASGNPIVLPRQPLSPEAARARLGLPADRPVVLVFGGSQGAERLNQVVAALLDSGAMDRVALCWGTGARHWQRYASYHRPPWRLVRAFWDPIAEVYAAADLAVARAGAMTTAELCAFGVPAILVPLTTAAHHHQSRNAEALARVGAAIHLPETWLSPERLWEAIRSVLEQPARAAEMRRRALGRARPDAARKIAERILALVS